MLIVKEKGGLLLTVIHKKMYSVAESCALPERNRVAKFGGAISQSCCQEANKMAGGKNADPA